MTMAIHQFDLSAAPMRIGGVRLKVRDLDAVSGFYARVLGLDILERGAGRAVLGRGGEALLLLAGDPGLAPVDPRQAGLFHTAFLLPARADLGRWLAHAGRTGVTLQGASDHLVSEAIYLADPEGNGIEVYADRPTGRWHGEDGAIRMATEPLDGPDLLRAAAGTAWEGFPAGGVVGHVHLRVGDTGAADGFYRDVLGFDIAARYPGASFYGSGGYHHNLAGNVWASRRAGMRPAGMAGLDAVRVVVREAGGIERIAGRAEAAGLAVAQEAGETVLRDPWGTALALVH